MGMCELVPTNFRHILDTSVGFQSGGEGVDYVLTKISDIPADLI